MVSIIVLQQLQGPNMLPVLKPLCWLQVSLGIKILLNSLRSWMRIRQAFKPHPFQMPHFLHLGTLSGLRGQDSELH